MEINIIKTDGHTLPAEVEVKGVILGVMDDFSMIPVENLDRSSGEFSYLRDENLSWDAMFQGNPDKETKLIRTGDWSYEAYGKIISINPVVADFGLFKLEVGYITNDTRCVGEWIFEKIERLDLTYYSKI
jgi:hypothetical protein